MQNGEAFIVGSNKRGRVSSTMPNEIFSNDTKMEQMKKKNLKMNSKNY